MTRRWIGAVAAIALLGVPFAPLPVEARTDQIQLTVNMIWCYQSQTRVEREVSLSDVASVAANVSGDPTVVAVSSIANMFDVRLGSANVVSVPRSWYIDSIRAAAAARSAGVLRQIYAACQAHNQRAMEYLEEADDSQVIMAARHAVACYPATPGGGRYGHNDRTCVGDVDW